MEWRSGRDIKYTTDARNGRRREGEDSFVRYLAFATYNAALGNGKKTLGGRNICRGKHASSVGRLRKPQSRATGGDGGGRSCRAGSDFLSRQAVCEAQSVFLLRYLSFLRIRQTSAHPPLCLL